MLVLAQRLDTLVAEAQLAVALNSAIFQELGAVYPGDAVTAA
ncbi:hypothetical protein ACIA5D_37295 [Actinoplanes sp. NPDC051513]